MYSLPLATLQAQVRTRLDEVAATSSDMLGNTTDDRNLDSNIEKLAVEAITSVHLSAPSFLMEGNTIKHNTTGITLPTVSVSSGVVTIDFSALTGSSAIDILRLVSYKHGDSNIVCYKAYPEDSMWGKAQLNSYLRGDKYNPFLVELHDSTMGAAKYKYYTTEQAGSETDPLTWELTYFPKPVLTTESAASVFKISQKLELAVINYTTGLVLQTYGQTEAANTFFERAKDAMEQ